MSYIVLDLEWNQAMSSNASVFNRLPIHLSGEIIQIGAVKLDDDFCPAGGISVRRAAHILPQHALQSQKAYRH